eukprot:1182130-Prorocentrum_minimum.AAC.3
MSRNIAKVLRYGSAFRALVVVDAHRGRGWRDEEVPATLEGLVKPHIESFDFFLDQGIQVRFKALGVAYAHTSCA